MTQQPAGARRAARPAPRFIPHPPADREPAPRERRGAESRARGHGAERELVPAIIGNSLRIPIMWCQFGACVRYYSHPAALGERDLRGRALAEGWRFDALGRLGCPDCVQRHPAFWLTHPPVLASDLRRLGR